MTRDDLISIIINSKSINATLKTIQPTDLRDDFRQHFYLQLLEIAFEKLLAIYNRGGTSLEAYAGGILRFQLKSNNSSFYKIYRKNTAFCIEDRDGVEKDYDNKKVVEGYEHIQGYLKAADDITDEQAFIIEEKNYQNILSMLRHIHPKRSKLFIEHYVNGKTIMEISKKYKIKYRTVHHSIRTTEQYLRDNLKFESD